MGQKQTTRSYLIAPGVLLALSTVARAQAGKLEKIAPGVWFREGEPISRNPGRPDEMGNPNSIIIEMNDYLVVVDADYPSGARLIMEAAKTVSPKPVKYVLITHHHGDRLYGAAEWRKAVAITVGHIGIVEELKRYEPNNWQGAARWRKDVAAMDPPAAELFTGQMLFLTELQKAVQNEINRGKKLEELVFPDPNKDPKFMLGNLQTTVQLPASVKHWISSDRLPRQFSDTYAQLTSGK